MTDADRALDAARKLEVEFGPDQRDRVARGIVGRAARRRTLERMAVLAVVLPLVGGGLFLATRGPGPRGSGRSDAGGGGARELAQGQAVVARRVAPGEGTQGVGEPDTAEDAGGNSAARLIVEDTRRLEWSDGTLAVATSERGELELVEDGASGTVVRIAQGAALFDVEARTSSAFEVEVGHLRIAVMGTRFEALLDEERVRVVVREGRVVVRSSASSEPRELAAGEVASFGRPDRNAKRASAAPQRQDWRPLVRAGEFDAAWKKLEGLDHSKVGRSAGELMDAADAARLSGHPRQAVGFLDRVLKAHARSPEAPLAAFTLGKIQRKDHPAKAAEAFGRARALAPYGALAEDALAHQVQALRAAGKSSRAAALAQEYLAAHPDGRWASSMSGSASSG